MAAGVYDIYIEQGADFELPLVWSDVNKNPVNLTGYSARMQIRENFDSDEYLIALDTGALGGITLGGATGLVTVEIPANITATFPLMAAVYDIELISASGSVYRFIQGAALISREVTR